MLRYKLGIIKGILSFYLTLSGVKTKNPYLKGLTPSGLQPR
jgi:hypothetical protein